MSLEEIQNISSLVLSGVSAIGIIFIIYHYFRNPDIRADKKLSINEATCEIKHTVVDDKFKEISGELKFMKENHLQHIEKSVANIEKDIAILKDRELRKQDVRE